MSAAESPPMLLAQGLSKSYGSHRALVGLDLSIAAGEVYCLLGPNGAGKTTTVNLFLGFIAPTAGIALVGGCDSQCEVLAARRQIAYIPENVMLYGPLSGIENLTYFTALATGSKLDGAEARQLLGEAGLQEEAIARPVATYSKGMRQKVGLAMAAAKRARVLLLDEPTSGLDPLAANDFTGMIRRAADSGMAVLMVTHDLFLAQECATRVGIMQRGRLVRVLAGGDIEVNTLERAYIDATRASLAQEPSS